MNSRFLLLCLALTVSAVIAQKPTPCETPALWQARTFQYDREKDYFSRGFISYDAIYKRIRIIDEFQLGKEKDAFDLLVLHSENVEYEYNLNTKECKKFPLRREWRDFRIPSDAKSIGESYIGSSGIPNAGLLTTMWEKEYTDSKGKNIYYFGEWTYAACLPIKIELYEKKDRHNKGLNSHDRFYDIIPGVAPEAFNIRKECQGL